MSHGKEAKLPAQLAWRDFVCILKHLGYSLYENKHGSARSFYNPNREPKLTTFHEPHGKDPIRTGTLREYIRKLDLTKEQFLEALKNC
jgi:predicted RNA binding protein YcfA (HicA-like mRNA interferase family)